MTELKRSRQNRVNEYLSKYAFFAFSEEQFREGLKKLGAKEEDLLPLSGTGGFILRDKAQGLYEILKEIDQEKQAALSDPESAYKLFLHELADHEYSYTGDETETLDSLGLTREEVEQSDVLSSALRKAKQKLMEEK